jgi:hypothetical protein
VDSLPQKAGWRRFAGLPAFAGLCALKALLLAPFLLYRSFEWSYPFFDGDGTQWLSNGLALVGERVAATGRQPLLPLLLGGLLRIGLLRCFPLVPLALAALLSVALFRRLEREQGTAVTWVCGLYLLLHFGLTEQSVQVMADLLATALLTGAVLALEDDAGSRPRRALAVALGAAAALAQQAVLLPLAAILAWRALRAPRREIGRSVWTLGGILLPSLLWQGWLRWASGWTLSVPQAQWAYLRLHGSEIDDYGLMALAFFGLPAVGLVAWELVRALRTLGGERSALVEDLIAWILVVTVFFVFLYDYRASRFCLYGLPPVVLLAGRRLQALQRRPALFALAGVAMILAGAWPQTPAVARVALWPLPPVELTAKVEATGDAPLDAGLQTPSLTDLRERSLPAQIRRARQDGATARAPAPPDLASIRGIVLLDDGATSVDHRYDLRDRLANTLRRRVKLAPCALFPPAWRGWQGAREVDRAGDLRFLRLEVAASESPWLVIAPERCAPSGPAPDLPALPGQSSSSMPPPSPAIGAPLRIPATLVAEIDRRTEGSDGFVAVVADVPRAQAVARALTLALRTSSYFVVDRATADRLPRLPAPEERLGFYRLARVRYGPWKALLLIPAESRRERFLLPPGVPARPP